MYEDLTLRERAAIIKAGVQHGMTSLPEIITAYNEFAEGGDLKDRGAYHSRKTLQDNTMAIINRIFHKPKYNGGEGGGAGSTTYFRTNDDKSSVVDTLNIPIGQTFNEAFAQARKQGLSDFNFNGKKYTTEIGNNPNWKAAGDSRIENDAILRMEVLRKNIDKPGEQIPFKLEEPLNSTIPVLPYTSNKKFKDGGKKVTPTKQQIVNAAWANENPTNRGYKNGKYTPYPDPNGRGQDVGPGLLIGKGIQNKTSYTKDELDNTAYAIGQKALQNIGDAYNKRYGSKNYPTPFDTVSVAPKLLMLDTRYQNGTLPIDKWPSLYQAVADGDWGEAIKQSRSTYKDKAGKVHYDNDRVRRRAETIFPNMFDVNFIKDSKTAPVVTPKKKK